MNKVVLSVVAALAVTAAAPAFAADMPTKAKMVAPAPAPSPWDIAIGAVVMSDYNFRGISQSNKGPSAGAYFEPQFNIGYGTLYVGLAGYAIDWPGTLPAYGFTSPSAEIDIYGGWRNSWGPLSLDLGFIYYFYPKETASALTTNSDFYEFYAKGAYAITADLTIGANVFYTPDLLNYSESFATGGISQDAPAVYASLTGKWVLPWKAGEIGAFVSGELGHWWIDDAGFTNAVFVAFNGNPAVDPSYTYWNAGIGLTYKALTLDLRYHGTDQGDAECNSFLLVTPGNSSTNWCGDTFIAALKFDTTLSALK